MMTLTDCKQVMIAFAEMLNFFQVNLKLQQFHNKSKLVEIDLCENGISIYCDHLSALKNDLETRFANLFNFTIQPWMTDPFDCDPHSAQDKIQEEVIEMKCKEEFQIKFKKESLSEFCQSDTVKSLYPNLWSQMSKILWCFPTLCVDKTGFSTMNHILQKERNRFDIISCGDIHICLSSIKPDIEFLAENHQSQGSP
ncbi:Hypothetical predicted protein [Octopus vulgaris]|uniref:Uncharacterized protein n=1 Tax=Octopus vulgaris TaxID=6645 RepID=A0AA36BFD8_OCTVU|nr:Hypothetical predicted protein [Octopus vulgaris]